MNAVRFVVEQAGCSSCAHRVRKALAEVATVDEIEIDEAADGRWRFRSLSPLTVRFRVEPSG